MEIKQNKSHDFIHKFYTKFLISHMTSYKDSLQNS